jgi:uncharacterized protein involved in exopolysaccharide biosynthesis
MKSPVEKTQQITLAHILVFLKQGWKIMVIGILLGGLTGLAVSSLRLPEFEAVSVFSFSIDFARTGLLTDIEEDQAMEVAGDVINSTDVFQATLERAIEKGLPVEKESFRSHLTAERRFDQWLLKVRWNDPEMAAKIADLWSEATRAALQDSRLAAWKADSIHRYLLSLETCLQQSTSGLPAQPLCQASNRAELLAEMENSGAELAHWTELSRGLFSGLNYTWAQEAAIPDSPVQYSRGSLVLAGCLAGMAAAAILCLFVLKI